MKKKFISLLLMISLVGCSTPQDDTYDIVVSSYALKFLVDEIAPDSLNVSLVEEDNINEVSAAKLVMYIDDEYDDSLKDVANAIEIYPMLYSSRDNPYFWLSPKQMILASEVVYSQILNTFPEHKDTLLDNYEELFEKLTDLDKQYENVFKDNDKTIVTSDDAFEHLKDYGFKYVVYDADNEEFFDEYGDNLDRGLCAYNSDCDFYDDTLFANTEVVEVNDLVEKPVNGNYFSAQYKNVLIFETLLN